MYQILLVHRILIKPMTTALDPRHAKHHNYRFPLSPPSSGTVTALSSPRLAPLDQVPQIVDSLFSVSPFRQSNSLTSVRSGKQRELPNLSDSDSNNTEKYSHISSRRKRSRNIMTKPLTHSPTTDPIPRVIHHGRSSPTSMKPLYRTSSSTSSSSCSSVLTNREEPAIHYPNVGMGRKVAATLQLFKETSGTSEDPSSAEPRAEVTLGNRRVEPFQEVEDVAEAFEFVKRSEWPARETAAIRRERSMTLAEKTKSRDSSINELERKTSLRETPLYDVAQWRRDHPTTISRGRRRERAFDELPGDTDPRPEDPLHPFPHESSPIFIRPRSRAYPPSPSPSPSPSKRTAFFHHVPETTSLSSVPAHPVAKHPHLPSIRITTRYSRSPTPVRTAHHPNGYVSNPISPLESLSSWSTDDESMWETASTASTVASNTSAYGYPSSTAPSGPSSPSTLLQKLPETLQVSDTSSRFSHLDQEDSLEIDPLANIDDRILAVNVNRPEERLPHIPLRPFRNQVGGHSAIYKFTKQAVCKVRFIRTPFFFFFFFQQLFSMSFSATGVARKSILRVCGT